MILYFILMGFGLGSILVSCTADVTTSARPDILSVKNTTARADIIFLVDSSVWLPYYTKQLDFVASTVMAMDTNVTRLGLALFSNRYLTVLDLDFYPNKTELNQTIRNAPYIHAEADAEKGIHGIRTQGFRAELLQDYVPKIGILVIATEKPFKYRSSTLAEAKLLLDENVWLHAVGVGSNANKDELTGIASKPTADLEFTFFVDSFKGLSGSSVSQKLLANVNELRSQPQTDDAVCGLNTKADILFVYNEAAMSSRHVTQVREFVKDMASNLSMATGNVRIGIISKGCSGEDIDMSKHLRRDDFINALSGQPKPGMGQLLEKLRLRGFAEGRYNAVKMAVIFLDDAMVDAYKVKDEARRLRDDGVSMHVMAVGPTYKLAEAHALASSPPENYVTKLGSYDELDTIGHNATFLENLCDTDQEKSPEIAELKITTSVYRTTKREITEDRVVEELDQKSMIASSSLKSDATAFSSSLLSLVVVVGLCVQSYG